MRSRQEGDNSEKTDRDATAGPRETSVPTLWTRLPDCSPGGIDAHTPTEWWEPLLPRIRTTYPRQSHVSSHLRRVSSTGTGLSLRRRRAADDDTTLRTSSIQGTTTRHRHSPLSAFTRRGFMSGVRPTRASILTLWWEKLRGANRVGMLWCG